MTKDGKFEITEANKKYWMASDPNNLDEFLWTWKQISTMLKVELKNLNKTAKLYSSSPNPELHDPESGVTKHLLSVAAKSVPLVVNFGSCSWSPFMVNLARIKKIQAKFANKVTFLTVYVQEAHPSEEEHFKNQMMQIKTHQTLSDRLEAANELLEMETLPGPFLVDNMKDEASNAFGAFPERLYIILDGKIVYQGGVGPMDYDPDEVNNWLEKYFSDK